MAERYFLRNYFVFVVNFNFLDVSLMLQCPMEVVIYHWVCVNDCCNKTYAYNNNNNNNHNNNSNNNRCLQLDDNYHEILQALH